MRKVQLSFTEVFRYAIATGRAEFNPAADLSNALEVHQSNHFPFLKTDEIPDFLRALDGYTGSRRVQIATKLLMITGVRTIELRSALWQEFDLDNAIWEIPAERMKMRKVHLVPLSTLALNLLNNLKMATGNCRHVFPGQSDPNKPMSKTNVKQVIKRIGHKSKRTGHGFRHMMSTILYEHGFDSCWKELQLTHVDKNTIRGTYNHLVYRTERTSMMLYFSDLLLLENIS